MKKGIKKLGYFAMLCTLALGMVGCGESKEPGSTTGGIPTDSNKPTETERPIVPTPTPTPTPVPTPVPTEDAADKILPISKILELCENNADKNRYYLKGTIVEILNPLYGEMTIKDETGELYVYGTYSKDGEIGYSQLTDKPLAGDEIVLSGIPATYNGKKELKSGWIQEIKHNQPEFNENEYQQLSIKECREKPVGAKIKATGIVARITYSSGVVPSGLILVDGTNSIYVYDSGIAAEAKIGNRLTVCGTRASWINADESSNAAKFGYKGCTQISNCHKLELDKSINEVDYSWVSENTIKKIVNNDPENDITSTIYKVNGFIKKSVNPGFTNYIINDLDDNTGSYVYTQANGNDFDWLDEFDGKICTIYLSPLNAKATSAGIQYRFLPVEVKYENYKFDLATGAEFALEYFAADQFEASYMVNPNLALENSVSFAHLGLNDVILSYESSNPDALSFKVADGKTLMSINNTNDDKATVTITAKHGDNVATRSLEIKINKLPEFNATNVKGAMDAEIGETVTVRGKVGSSLVNQDGFYLIDETGVIAVKTTKEVLGQLKLQNEVVIEGVKALRGKSTSPIEFHYQLILNDARLIVNFYGDEPYSTAAFKNMTLADAKALDVDVHENTMLGITVENVKVKFTGSGYSTNVFLVDEATNTELMLYCNGSKQYKWLEAYKDMSLKADICVCNWNSAKGGYKATVLAVYNEDGTKTCNSLNFN